MCSPSCVLRRASSSRAMLIYPTTKKKSSECFQSRLSKFSKLNHLNSTHLSLMTLKMSPVSVWKDSCLYPPILLLNHLLNGVKYNCSSLVVLHKLLREKLSTVALNRGVWMRKILLLLSLIKLFLYRRVTTQLWTWATLNLRLSQGMTNIIAKWTRKWLKCPPSRWLQI